MTLRRRLLTLALIAALSGSLTACGGVATRRPSRRATRRAWKIPAPATTPARLAVLQPAGKTSSPARQMNTYNAALRRWEQYTKLSNEIYRKGKDTPEARRHLAGVLPVLAAGRRDPGQGLRQGRHSRGGPPGAAVDLRHLDQTQPSGDRSNAPTTATIESRRTVTFSTTSPSTWSPPHCPDEQSRTDGDWKFRGSDAEGQGVMRRLIATAIALSAALLKRRDSTVHRSPSLGRRELPVVSIGTECACPMRRIAPVPDEPPQGSEAATGTSSVGGPRVCRDEGKVIPCSKGGFSWMSSATGGCYGAMLDNAAGG